MKRFLSLVAIVLVVVGIGAYARDTWVKQDQSVRVMNRFTKGTTVAEYRYVLDGDGGANAGVHGVINWIDLDVKIPYKAIIQNVSYMVAEALLPAAGCTSGLSLHTAAGDLVALSVNGTGWDADFGNEGIPDLATESHWMQSTNVNDSTVYLLVTGNAITGGVMRAYIDWVQGLEIGVPN